MEGGTVAATAFLVSAFRLLVLAARLRADFSFRFRTAFFAADILVLRMDIPFASYSRCLLALLPLNCGRPHYSLFLK
jgi:hypothetical protein